MHLKVGELAQRTGVTVRTLHHYDELGLLRPSGRSEGGYRLYQAGDIVRLHAIQALRQLGLPLADIGSLLDKGQGSPEAVLGQQMQALDLQIRRATELRERIAVLRDELLQGKEPDAAEWVRSLSLMTTYGRYFSSAELREILASWRGIAAEWEDVKAQVQAAMDADAPVDSPQVQLVARRWMALMHRWMGGDFDRIERWGTMYRQETWAHGIGGAPGTAMLAYMERAIGLRVSLLARHYGPRLRELQLPSDAELAALQADVERAMRSRRRGSAAADAVVDRWLQLVERCTRGDAQLHDKMLTLHTGDPLLLVGSPLRADARAWLLEQVRARGA